MPCTALCGTSLHPQLPKYRVEGTEDASLFWFYANFKGFTNRKCQLYLARPGLVSYNAKTTARKAVVCIVSGKRDSSPRLRLGLFRDLLRYPRLPLGRLPLGGFGGAWPGTVQK